MTEQAAKRQLRSEMKQVIGGLDAGVRRSASVAACARLTQCIWVETARTIMLYAPLPDELDVEPAIVELMSRGLTVCLPSVSWETGALVPTVIEAYPEGLVSTKFGVREPGSGHTLRLDELDCVVAPGLAFDRRGARLGRGGGFYDRLLFRPDLRANRVGVAFDAQIVDVLPTRDDGPHPDAFVDAVLTERRMFLGFDER